MDCLACNLDSHRYVERNAKFNFKFHDTKFDFVTDETHSMNTKENIWYLGNQAATFAATIHRAWIMLAVAASPL